ncbi:carbohydrate esterase / alpha-galactosidase [Nitzschia inconspicua]|uniref:Carbohydrate esterase / alpha-galactosidase n=1 Tax=Nitzschia inconspicua TaxID=303405 RepID=A0A9K3LJ67_9STRA|nr:carbohydrate esterase / alpha-galactosidase [Nitzschia inconspicua]
MKTILDAAYVSVLLVLLLSAEAVPIGRRRCGDGHCRFVETCRTCPEDCGECSEGVGLFPQLFPLQGFSSKKRIKVFFLFGQSNMQGHGCKDHLTELLNNPITTTKYSHLWDVTTNDWAERPDVRIRNCGQEDNPYPCRETTRLRSVGEGATVNKFGPETGFGWTMGDALEEDIFLCKAAWGGKDLAIDFRPPNSSDTMYNGDESPLSLVYDGIDPKSYSVYYEEALGVFQKCIEEINVYAPGYDSYEMAGFVFFQGWNDVVDLEKVGEYQYNLRNLIFDIRNDLGLPTVPMVVGQLGQHTSAELASWKSDMDPGIQERWDRVMAVRWAQGNATEKSVNAALAETSLIVDSSDRCPTYADGTLHEDVCGCDSYHYYNNAQIVYDIGVDMANKMLTLL